MSLGSEQPWHLAAELQRAPHRARHDRHSGPGPFTEIKITYRTHGRALRPQSLVSDLPGGCEVSSGAHGEAAPLTMTRTDPGIQSGRGLCQTKPFGEKR